MLRMRAEVYWIHQTPQPWLAILPRPRAGDWLPDEVESWRQSGLEVMVSLLEPDEVAELGLAEEADLCTRAGLRFVSFPIPDRGVPESAERLTALVSDLEEEFRAGRRIGIHCRIGVGRAALVAACLLVRQGMPSAEVWPLLTRSRGQSVPDTPEQVHWLEAWGQRYAHVAPRPE
jgi:protein-tyrosine phosphatase